MNKHQKLELTWIGKDQRPKLEPRILVEDPAKSHHAPFRTGKSDLFDNRLIFGDNLLALKALEQEFAGKIKCIYIDPPYNTGSAFSHYDDGVEHSLWLSLMRDRLGILQRLLAEDGIIFVQIDDNEQSYLRCTMDEIFGRPNFIATFIWGSRAGKGATVRHVAPQHEYIHTYAKNSSLLHLNKEERVKEGGQFEDDKGLYSREMLRQWGQGQRKEDRPTMFYAIHNKDGREVLPRLPDGSWGRWRVSKKQMNALLENDDVDFVEQEGELVAYRKIRAGRITRSAYGTLLFGLGTSATGTAEIKNLFGYKAFDTTKPEGLICHLFKLATRPGDWVLDSFAGSGTTGAVAHKMGRRWIMVELGEHCHTHIIPRLKKVIDGEDKGGVTEAMGWKGGGGFRYYRLGPSLLQKDEFGNWVISKEYNPSMLAEAICKLEGFTYAPSDTAYWRHGHSTETDFIYVTTQTLTREQLQKLSDEIGESRSLLVMCGAFRVKNLGEFPNLTVKKIPKAVLNRCEWGKDDYSLEIQNLPVREEPLIGQVESDAERGRKGRTKAERRAQAAGQPSLFDLPTQEKKP